MFTFFGYCHHIVVTPSGVQRVEAHVTHSAQVTALKVGRPAMMSSNRISGWTHWFWLGSE